jgi:hypothetical protein
MKTGSQQIQLKAVNRRLDRLEAEITIIAASLKKKRATTLDVGLKDLAMDKVHKYKSVKSLMNDVWG